MDYFAYILSNKSQTLYTGITNDLPRRVSEHRLGEGSAFARKYNCRLLVWYERFGNATDAIAAEKRIKGWTRVKKIALIESMNPDWLDLTVGENRLKILNRRHPERSEGPGSS